MKCDHKCIYVHDADALQNTLSKYCREPNCKSIYGIITLNLHDKFK